MTRSKHFIILNLDSYRRDLSEELRPVLDKALDWIEITPNSWLLWTSSSSKKWLERIRGSNLRVDHLFVAEINPEDRAGRLPDEVWRFIVKHENQITK